LSIITWNDPTNFLTKLSSHIKCLLLPLDGVDTSLILDGRAVESSYSLDSFIFLQKTNAPVRSSYTVNGGTYMAQRFKHR